MIEAIQNIESMAMASMEQKNTTAPGFADLLADGISHVDDTIKVAEQSVQALAVGESDNLHQVMINLSKAKTQFELTVEVRNRVVEGLQEILRMSV